MRRWVDLIVLSIVTTFVVPLLWFVGQGLIFTVPVLDGLVIGLFIRRTARPVGVTLAFALIPPIARLAYDIANWSDADAALRRADFHLYRVTVFAMYTALLVLCGAAGAAIGARSARRRSRVNA